MKFFKLIAALLTGLVLVGAAGIAAGGVLEWHGRNLDRTVEMHGIDTGLKETEIRLAHGVQTKLIDREVELARVAQEAKATESRIEVELAKVAQEAKATESRIEADLSMHRERLDFMRGLDSDDFAKYLLSQ